MSTGDLLKFMHVLTAFWLVGGILGRNFADAQAAKAATLAEMEALFALAGRLDVLMVRAGSFAVLIAGLATAWERGWPVFGFIEGAADQWLLVSLLLYVASFLLVPLVFLPRGRIFTEALAGARAAGTPTAELRASMNDGAVNGARAAEMAAIVVVIFLMVTKPF